MTGKLSKLLSSLAILAVTLGLAPQSSPLASSASSYNEDDIVYMLLTDRFSDGDPSNNDQGAPGGEYVPGNLKFYQGGDWQGIINHVGYLKNLGVTAVWISPVSDDQDISKDGGEAGYHGYFTYDYDAPNPHFGTVGKLQQLGSLLDANGLDLVLDVVPNHTGNYLDPYANQYNPPDYHPAAPFDNPSWYHHNGDVTDWDDQWLVENGDIGGLDDLAQELPQVQQELYNAYGYWFEQTGADAARVDAARSMPKWFLQGFEQNLGVPTFGEVFYGDVDYVSDYQNYEWGVLDFPLFFEAREVFAHDDSFRRVANVLNQDSKYPAPNRLHTFLDNHDRDRFLAMADDDWSRLRLGLSFLFTTRGIPVIYYGTEQAYYGDGLTHEWQGIANEQNRQMLEEFDQNHPIYKHIQRLAQIRTSNEALRRGTQREMWVEDHVYAYSRRIDATGEEVITALSNSWDPQTRTIPLRAESSIPVGTVLTNLLDTREHVTVQSGGLTGKQITVSLTGKEAQILVANGGDTYVPPEATVTTIRVHYDTGYGNSIWIRGNTYPFWWDRGRAARWTNGNVWVWQTERIPAGQTFQFKPLINDTTWSLGQNFVGTGGQTIDVYPTFY